MKIISVFNNKGGVGKTTLTFHLAHALGELGYKVLLMDLDPQCNLTIFSLDMEDIHDIWTIEDPFIDDFDAARNVTPSEMYKGVLNELRSIHFLLKPTEDGTAELAKQPPPAQLGYNVDLLPGRLTLHLYEAKVGERWAGIYQGDPLAIRTATRVRTLAQQYTLEHNYDFVILDTSPSLGALNRDLLSLADGFIIPCSPDLFSVYGIRNIGNALKVWQKQFQSVFHFLSDQKRDQFPSRFVEFLGYTIYNARKYTTSATSNNPLSLAIAHYNYAKQIPSTIHNYIAAESRTKLSLEVLDRSIGHTAIIHSHNTLPSMAQKYHKPMWLLPRHQNLEPHDRSTISGNRAIFENTQEAYHEFAKDFIERVSALDL
jgi:cellulose biosynthesis protein BcsQ